MNYTYQNRCIRLKKPPHFSLDHIFHCGQTFRFFKEGPGYLGIAYNRVILVYETSDLFVIDNTTEKDFNQIWAHYFDLERDYAYLSQHFSQDAVMSEAISYGHGIRILNQDIWECLITFILSQQNNIPRITKIVSALCENFGQPLFYHGKMYHAFPTPEKLASLSLEDLAIIGSGFRAKYLLEAAKMVKNGEIDLDAIKHMDTAQARLELLKIKGVGPKVADCILLFGAGKHDAFPVDVWIDRVINTLYNKDQFCPDLFGEYCGIAQQYLFFYGRGLKIGK